MLLYEKSECAMSVIGASVSEPHTSEQCGTCLVRPYVLVLVLITSKSLPALILRVLASFVHSKTVHKLVKTAPFVNPKTIFITYISRRHGQRREEET